jgi:hypothetical protein
MKIVTIITDGRGNIRLAATRAPDLYRRSVAAETGDAWLTWVGIAPTELGARTFVGRLDHAWRAAWVADGVYRISPEVAIRTAYRELILIWLRRKARAAVRLFRRRLALRRS